MGLYISNPTKQDQVLNYRLLLADRAEDRLARSVFIPSGKGELILQGAPAAVVENVILQLERFGARDAAEAHNRALGRFSGVLYRRDGEISTDEILEGHDAIVATQQQRSVEQTVNAALGFDRGINGGKRGQRRARTTQVEVLQEVPAGQRATGDEVVFGLTVDPDGSETFKYG
jgi:hypothetical protein